MTTVAEASAPEDSNEQISSLLPTALSGVTEALAVGLNRLIRNELKKHSGVAALNSAVTHALPKLLERSFHDALLAAELETHYRRVAMLHLLTTVELESLRSRLLISTQTGIPNGSSEFLTTEEAATLLGVSRTHVISLISSNALSASLTNGGHRRIAKDAVLDYKEDMKKRQSSGLDAMMAATAALGLYDDELAGIPKRSRRKKV